jgi:hypothetical protein
MLSMSLVRRRWRRVPRTEDEPTGGSLAAARVMFRQKLKIAVVPLPVWVVSTPRYGRGRWVHSSCASWTRRSGESHPGGNINHHGPRSLEEQKLGGVSDAAALVLLWGATNKECSFNYRAQKLAGAVFTSAAWSIFVHYKANAPALQAPSFRRALETIKLGRS